MNYIKLLNASEGVRRSISDSPEDYRSRHAKFDENLLDVIV